MNVHGTIRSLKKPHPLISVRAEARRAQIRHQVLWTAAEELLRFEEALQSLAGEADWKKIAAGLGNEGLRVFEVPW